MITKIKPILVKEARQIIRDKLSLGIIIFIPVFMLGMFGYALSFDVKNITIGFYDEDNSKTSRDFINSFIQTEYFDLKSNASSSKEIERLLQEGIIKVGVIIPSAFSKDIVKGLTTKVQVFVDGSNSTTASAIVGYVNGVISNYSTKILVRKLEVKANINLSEPIDYRPRIWYNPELKSAKFLVLGLISFILLITSVILTSLSIVREKEKNTIEQIIVSPIKAYELIIGKTITYIIIALITAILIFIVSYFLFNIVIKGSYFLLFISILIYLITSLGVGLLISSVSESQQVAFMISAIITLLPTFVLSGFAFPIRNMPIAVQLVTYLVPARYFLVILRSIVLKGSGIESFWKDMLALIIMSLILLGLSIRRIRKNII